MEAKADRLYLAKKGKEINKIRCGEHLEGWEIQSELGPKFEGQWFNGCDECDDQAVENIVHG